MANFSTRPNLDNRDFTQTSGSTITLYGMTNVDSVGGELNINGILRSKGIIIDTSTGSTGTTIGYGLVFNGEKILLQSVLSTIAWGDVVGNLENQYDLWNYISGLTTNIGDLTGATNGLTKIGKDVILGGRLSGTTTLIFEQSGTSYGNISNIIKMGEAENAISIRTTSTQVTNPITEIKSNADGVEISHTDDITTSNINTNDSGNEMLTLDVTGGSHSRISTGIDSQNNLPFAKLQTVRGSNSAVNEIKVQQTGITLTLQNFNNSDLIKLEISNDGGSRYTDNRIIKTGIQYGGNYRTGFTEYTLVDKGYVDNLFPSAITRTELFTYYSTASTYYLSANPLDILFLDVNGLVQRKGIDYTTSGNNVNILTAYDTGDIIQVVYYEQNIAGMSVEAFWGDINGTIETQSDLVDYIDQEILDSIGQTIVSGVTGQSASLNVVYQGLDLKADNSILLRKSLSSGIISGGGITISSDPSKINIAPISGIIVDNWTNPYNPVVHYIEYAGQTGISVTYLATSTTSHIGIDKNGTIQQYPQSETNTQRRDSLMLGILGHSDNTIVRSINSTIATIESPIEQLRDLFNEFKLINNGNVITPNGTNLNINKSVGTLFGDGINGLNNRKDPHRIVISASTVASFRYRTQTGGTSSTVTLIDPLTYDNGGVATLYAGSSNQATNQRVFLFPNGNLVIQYGQTIYSTLSAAIQGVQSELFIEYINVSQEAILIGIISLTKGCTNLSDTSTAKFIPVSKFGENIGGAAGISTSTLQQVYNNSTQPEITTNSTLGAITIKRGSSNDNDNVIEILNGSGTTKTRLDGNGYIYTPKIDIIGSLGFGIRTITGNTILTIDDTTVLVDASSGTTTVTLPVASGFTRNFFIIKKIDPTINNVIIPNVDGGTKIITTQYAGYTVQSNGIFYYMIGSF